MADVEHVSRSLLSIVIALLFLAACGSSSPAVPNQLAFADESNEPTETVETTTTVEPEPPAEPDVAEASSAFCEASANIWMHSTALTLIGSTANLEMNQVALANVAEWLERSTLFDDPAVPERVAMFDAFSELQSISAADFGHDWHQFLDSSTYAESDAAKLYETERSDLLLFIDERCSEITTTMLETDAVDRAQDLEADFGTAPSTIAESDSLPGHAIFTHSSGRLIASFPSAWSYEERGNGLADLIASPDVERFLNGDAIDGVHLQLVNATTISEFRAQLAGTRTGESCLRTDDLTDDSGARLYITQSFDCSDHGASLIGQFDPTTGVGLIVEASFDRVDASRADLIRLASISNSALWS